MSCNIYGSELFLMALILFKTPIICVLYESSSHHFVESYIGL